MKKRLVGLVVLGFILLLAAMPLSGCGGKETPSSGDSSAPAAEPIILGVPTGLGTIEGADGLKSVEMAAEEINKAGGVNVGGEKRPFKVVSIDTRELDPGIPVHDALAAIEKLITQEKPNALVVSSGRSEVMLSAMDLIGKYKIPNIISIAMSPAFEQKIAENYDTYKYNFRMGLNSIYMVKYLSDSIGFIGKKFNLNKAYLVNQDVLWAEGTANGLKAALEAQGWTVVGKDAYPTGASDFSASLTKAKQGGAQVIVPIFDMPQSGVLLKQARSMQVPALLAGYISPAVPEGAWDTFNGDVDGFVTFISEIGEIPIKAVPKSVEYIDNYGQKYGDVARKKLAGHGPSPAYDSVYVLKAAIEKANSLDPDALVKALEETDMDGAIGKVKFDKNHQAIYGYDPKEGAMGAAFQWVNGKRVVVFPESIAEGEVVLPSYMK